MNPQLRRHMKLIASLSLVCFIGMGATISAIGLFFNPVREEFGWSNERVSGLASAFLIAMSLATLLAGWLLDRLGAKRVMAAGVLLTGLGCLWAGVAGDSLGMIGGFALAGAGTGASTYVPSIFVAASRIRERLGLAIGIILAAASLGSALLPPVVAHLILTFGWRAALTIIGALILLVSLPLVAFTVPGRRPAGGEGDETTPDAEGLDLSAALRRPVFWGLAAIQLFFAIGFMGIYFHVVPYLIDRGFSLRTTALLYGSTNAMSAVGLVILGGLADRFGAGRVLVTSLLLYAASALLLGSLGDPSAAYAILAAFIVIWGATQGATTQLVPMLLAGSMGLRRFGALSGIVAVLQGAGEAVGPVMTGAIEDRTGSYPIAFYVCALAVLLAVVPAMFVPRSRAAGTLP